MGANDILRYNYRAIDNHAAAVVDAERLLQTVVSAQPTRFHQLIVILNAMGYTFKSIGDVFGLTKERIRQLHVEAVEWAKYDLGERPAPPIGETLARPGKHLTPAQRQEIVRRRKAGESYPQIAARLNVSETTPGRIYRQWLARGGDNSQ